MKKIMLICLGAFLGTLPFTVFAQIPAQIVIAFTPLGNVSSQAIPLSPWLNGLIAMLLMGVVWIFLRRQTKHSSLLMVLAAVICGMGLSPKITDALIAITPLVTSPTSLPVILNCGLNTYPFSNGLPNGLVITDVKVMSDVNVNGLVIDISSTCKAGTQLTGSQQCNVVIKESCA